MKGVIHAFSALNEVAETQSTWIEMHGGGGWWEGGFVSGFHSNISESTTESMGAKRRRVHILLWADAAERSRRCRRVYVREDVILLCFIYFMRHLLFCHSDASLSPYRCTSLVYAENVHSHRHCQATVGVVCGNEIMSNNSRCFPVIQSLLELHRTA